MVVLLLVLVVVKPHSSSGLEDSGGSPRRKKKAEFHILKTGCIVLVRRGEDTGSISWRVDADLRN